MAADKRETITLSGLEVSVWLPRHPDKAPVVLFSHGYGGCATQSAFFLDALAQAGYAVFSPHHRDAACGRDQSRPVPAAPVSFDAPETWTPESYHYRRDDTEALLDQLPSDPRYRRLDWRRVGMAGHSLGGYAALALGGGLKGWKDDRIRAVLAFSPSIRPLLAQHDMPHMAVPVMYQGGTRDPRVTPFLTRRGGAYDQTPAPKHLVEFDGASHLSWTDLQPDRYYPAITRYGIAFFDTYLKGKPTFLTAQPGAGMPR